MREGHLDFQQVWTAIWLQSDISGHIPQRCTSACAQRKVGVSPWQMVCFNAYDHYLCRVILDIRNNGGGLFPAGVEVARTFLNDGDIVLIADSQGVRDSYPASNVAVEPSKPLSVLVNRGTASASEVPFFLHRIYSSTPRLSSVCCMSASLLIHIIVQQVNVHANRLPLPTFGRPNFSHLIHRQSECLQ